MRRPRVSQLVLVVDEFSEKTSPTGRLSSELVRKLRVHGHSVWHINGLFKYRPGGLAVRRIINLVAVAVATTIAMPLLALRSLFTGRAGYVICNSTPPLLHLMTCLLAKVLHLGHMAWIQDLHPEYEARLFDQKGLHRMAALVRAVDRWILPLSTDVVTMDAAMAAKIRQLSRGKIAAVPIPPWGTYVAPAQRLRTPPPGMANRRLLYAGNYGAAHDLSPLAERLASLSAEDLGQLSLTFIGMGDESKARLRELFAASVNRLEFKPRFDKLSSLCQFMGEFDYGIVSLANDCGGLSCPSKALTYLSQGLPIFYVGPKDTLAAQLAAAGWGKTLALAFDSGQTDSVTRGGDTFPDPREHSLDAMLALVERFGSAKPATDASLA